MHASPRFQAITARFSSSSLRASFRRSSSASSRASSDRDSCGASVISSPANTINSIIHHQPSILGMEEERRSFGSELSILEPRPVVYWGSVEERIAHF
ncbi:hypothetical protein BN1723_001061, partial [Verticillium longisporum]|uniref:Calcium channel subunit cch1 n=3 Tax=Verticillium TaxID=1036719 RepID=G2XFA8_VERDV|nr:uncharacterized protein VDAG_08840 [Verticillium dahliae VdLs.17]KAF3348972.1 Vitamin H transporter [Verticillium dahliae VDG2]KAG7114207.1 hypothetical protein HYQ44_008909 [Verticillium longisporum]PNH34627.1 hypothetical protein BJF96_g2331 [Verticillium dahliae]EGY18506.1 hypothetical protein VDAG_08840 [Verticillium dahliae VdLs.17]PNH40618.1 hypothetical protein VD0004_g6379 [Verticillium dahliae]